MKIRAKMTTAIIAMCPDVCSRSLFVALEAGIAICVGVGVGVVQWTIAFGDAEQ